jgi:hypothetical protein
MGVAPRAADACGAEAADEADDAHCARPLGAAVIG